MSQLQLQLAALVVSMLQIIADIHPLLPTLLTVQAMMGFVFAIAGEVSSNHGVVSQVAGRWEDQELGECR